VSQSVLAKPKAHVVLIDDDPAVLASLTFAFQVDGFEVEAFASAAEAVGSNLAAASCLVVDYRLPGRDGLAMVEHLRRHGFRAPTVLITSHPTSADRASAAALGVPIVEKPLLTSELVDLVHSVARPAEPPSATSI